MSTMRIRQLGDPILRQVAKEVPSEKIVQAKTSAIIAQMQTVLDGIKAISDENGNAISAPQIGESLRIILLRIDNIFVAMINPEFRAISDEKRLFEEECFSFYQLRGLVERSVDIEIKYLDQNGTKQCKALNGEFAALAQHEIDHLDGVFFLDRISDLSSVRSVKFDLQSDHDRYLQVQNMISYMTASPAQESSR